jgi:hypothetical protein
MSDKMNNFFAVIRGNGKPLFFFCFLAFAEFGNTPR